MSEVNSEKQKALELAMAQIDRQFGKGSIMRLGDEKMARGIDATTARGILTAAFADTILERIELESVRDDARRAVSERLPRRIETT